MEGIRCRARRRPASTGTSVRLTTIETTRATVSAKLNDWKNCPVTPRTKASGKKTRIVVSVEPITAPLISRLARSMASSPVCPSARCRAMFSMTTTESSMIRPMATASPPSDIRFSVSPESRRKRKLITRLKGIARAVSSVARTLLRNNSRITTLNRPPITIASRTLAIEVRTSRAWS